MYKLAIKVSAGTWIIKFRARPDTTKKVGQSLRVTSERWNLRAWPTFSMRPLLALKFPDSTTLKK